MVHISICLSTFKLKLHKAHLSLLPLIQKILAIVSSSSCSYLLLQSKHHVVSFDGTHDFRGRFGQSYATLPLHQSNRRHKEIGQVWSLKCVGIVTSSLVTSLQSGPLWSPKRVGVSNHDQGTHSPNESTVRIYSSCRCQRLVLISLVHQSVRLHSFPASSCSNSLSVISVVKQNDHLSFTTYGWLALT